MKVWRNYSLNVGTLSWLQYLERRNIFFLHTNPIQAIQIAIIARLKAPRIVTDLTMQEWPKSDMCLANVPQQDCLSRGQSSLAAKDLLNQCHINHVTICHDPIESSLLLQFTLSLPILSHYLTILIHKTGKLSLEIYSV